MFMTIFLIVTLSAGLASGFLLRRAGRPMAVAILGAPALMLLAGLGIAAYSFATSRPNDQFRDLALFVIGEITLAAMAASALFALLGAWAARP